MKKLKEALGLGIIFILSQPVLADTCYDSHPNLKDINEKTVTQLPTTHDLQGWDQQWEKPDANNQGMIKNNNLNATGVVFRQVSYSPGTGLLRCVYHVTDGPYYLLGNNQLTAVNSQQPPINGSFVRMIDAGNLDLTKGVSIDLDSIKSSSLWHASPDSPNTFVCASDDVQACAFTTK